MEQQTVSRRRFIWRTLIPIVVLLAIVVFVVVPGFLFVFGKRPMPPGELAMEGEPPGSDMAKMEAPMAPEPEYAPEAASDASSPVSIPFGSAAYAAEIKRKIIYTADFTIEADDVDVAADTVETVVKATGGWVAQKQVQEYTPGERTCSITVRVPVVKFVELCDTFRELGRVRSEGIETDDVTEEFVDLEARLKNLNREEGILLELFDRRGKVADVLQVERELSRVRGEIERIQGRLKYLKDRVNYSTITATLHTKRSEAVREMDKWDLGYHVLRAWRALVNVTRALTHFLIYTVIVAGPFIILALIIWRIVRAIRRRRRPEPELPPPTDVGQ